MKPKLSFDDLYEHLQEKGISFSKYTREEVIEYLQKRSYYYKIASYRKNFPKTSNGKYEHLTFENLTQLASIDVYLREVLLDMCLDIEHLAKTQLMTSITENEEEDGYSLINLFAETYPEKYDEIIRHFERSSYKKDMFRKRTTISIWVFLEIIDLGALIMLTELYYKKYPDLPKFYHSQYKFIKNIRNTCAHNNVFLINLFDKDDHIPRPNAPTKSYANSMKINLGLVHYPKIIDIVNLFYIHRELCSKELNQRRYNETNIVLQKYKILDKKSDKLDKFFNIIQKSVDFLIASW